jgi:hypothetical protein
MNLWNWIQRRRAGNDRTRLRQLVSGQERAPQAIKLRQPQPYLPDVQPRVLGAAPEKQAERNQHGR